MWAFIFKKVGGINLAVILTIITIVILAVWHYNGLINELTTLRSDKVKLETAVETQKDIIDKAVKTIKEWKDSQDKLIATMEEMARISADANTNFKTLTELYSKHDLELLSSKKPKLIENSINRGTSDALRMLACTTGDKNCSR